WKLLGCASTYPSIRAREGRGPPLSPLDCGEGARMPPGRPTRGGFRLDWRRDRRRVRRGRMIMYRRPLLLLLVALALPLRAAPAEDGLPVILAVGESTTAGFGVGPEQSYPAQLQALLKEAGFPHRVVNHGRSGSTSAMALAGL